MGLPGDPSTSLAIITFRQLTIIVIFSDIFWIFANIFG